MDGRHAEYCFCDVDYDDVEQERRDHRALRGAHATEAFRRQDDLARVKLDLSVRKEILDVNVTSLAHAKS